MLIISNIIGVLLISDTKFREQCFSVCARERERERERERNQISPFEFSISISIRITTPKSRVLFSFFLR